MGLQGTSIKLFIVHNKKNSLRKNLDLYKSPLKNKIFAFSTFVLFIDENELSLEENLNADILKYLEILKTNFFKYYFKDYT